MSRTSHYLLVVDPASEQAAQINSLLRNSGISIHVLHAGNSLETRRLLREFKPLALLYHPASEAKFPVAEAAMLAHELDTLFAVRTVPGEAGALVEAMRHTPAIGVDRHDDQKLIKLVGQLLNNALAARQYALAQQSEDEVAARLALLLESTDLAVAYLHEGLHAAANSHYLELMKVKSFSELEGVSLLEILHSDQHDLKQLLRGFGHDEFPKQRLEFIAKAMSGEEFPVSVRFDPTRLDGEACVQVLLRTAGELSNPAAVTVTSIDEQSGHGDVRLPDDGHAPPPMAPKEAAARAGDSDPLTGLLRRAVFMQWLEQRIDSMPEDRRGGLFYLQPDTADNALAEASVAQMDRYTRALARAISQHMGAEDLACRFGDYSFALLAQRADKNQLRDLAGLVRKQVHELDAQEPELSLPKAFSIGFVLLDAHSHDAETAIAQSRAAWRQAHESGDSIVRYKPERALGLDDSEEAQWKHRLRYALDNEDFYTAQYVITNLEGETEGLIENRTFLHEDDADLPLDEFRAAAEVTGMASQIDRYIIPALFRVLAGSKERHIINISSRSLQDFSFPSWLRREMITAGVDGAQLVLQWPVSAAREHPKAARRLIEELQTSGCRFSLSGMDGELQNRALAGEFEPAYIRLDPLLTTDLRSHPEHADLINLVVREARAIDALTIASDVSNSNDLAMLWQCGVKLVSGDFLQSAPRVIGV